MKLNRAALAALLIALAGCGGGGTVAGDIGVDGTATTLPPPDTGSSVIVDHRQAFATATLIPDAWMAQARALRIMFGHQSVGRNILDGLAALQNHRPSRCAVTILTYPDENPGGCVSQFSVGTNGDPPGKILDFQTKVDSGAMPAAQVALFKFCFVDFTDTTNVPALLNGYESTMSALEARHPTVRFVYCTVPIETAFLATREQLNEQLRTYCSSNNKALFDIASIESYDPSDNPIGGAQPTLYAGYAQGDGAHLNTAGSIRVARAWWWLMARLAGWDET